MKDSKVIKPSDKYATKYDHEKAILGVYNIEMKDAGKYICRAVNELGQTETGANLIVKSVEKPKQKAKSEDLTPVEGLWPRPKWEEIAEVADSPPEFSTKLVDQSVKAGHSLILRTTSKSFNAILNKS